MSVGYTKSPVHTALCGENVPGHVPAPVLDDFVAGTIFLRAPAKHAFRDVLVSFTCTGTYFGGTIGSKASIPVALLGP